MTPSTKQVEESTVNRPNLRQVVRVASRTCQLLAALALILVPDSRSQGLLMLMGAAWAVSLWESMTGDPGRDALRLTLRQLHERFASGQLRSDPWETVASLLTILAFTVVWLDRP